MQAGPAYAKHSSHPMRSGGWPRIRPWNGQGGSSSPGKRCERPCHPVANGSTAESSCRVVNTRRSLALLEMCTISKARGHLPRGPWMTPTRAVVAGRRGRCNSSGPQRAGMGRTDHCLGDAAARAVPVGRAGLRRKSTLHRTGGRSCPCTMVLITGVQLGVRDGAALRLGAEPLHGRRSS